MMQPKSSSSDRIGYLESIRGLAAIQVLLLHSVIFFAPSLIEAQPSSGQIGSYIHLSPLYFLYDGYSAVYIFFVLSGFVLSKSFAGQTDRPATAMTARAVRLGMPAIAATVLAAAVFAVFGRPNVEVAALMNTAWLATQWNPDLSLLSVLRDGIANAIFLGYLGISSVPFFAPWQQPVEQSFVAPLWTLSTEFYGSLLVLLLCMGARTSRRLWWTAMIAGTIYFFRSPYICFLVGHAAAMLLRDASSLPSRPLAPVFAIICGVSLCVTADFAQWSWLRELCQSPTSWLFPGPSAPQQQKAFGAILVLGGAVSLSSVRAGLSHPRLVSWSRLSFPLYLVHWPILFGPTATCFLYLQSILGIGIAAIISFLIGIGLSFAASVAFLPVDRFALQIARRLRMPLAAASLHDRIAGPKTSLVVK